MKKYTSGILASLIKLKMNNTWVQNAFIVVVSAILVSYPGDIYLNNLLYI